MIDGCHLPCPAPHPTQLRTLTHALLLPCCHSSGMKRTGGLASCRCRSPPTAPQARACPRAVCSPHQCCWRAPTRRQGQLLCSLAQQLQQRRQCTISSPQECPAQQQQQQDHHQQQHLIGCCRHPQQRSQQPNPLQPGPAQLHHHNHNHSHHKQKQHSPPNRQAACLVRRATTCQRRCWQLWSPQLTSWRSPYCPAALPQLWWCR